MDRYGMEGGPLHDPCVIAYLLDKELFGGKPCRVDIETESELTMGQTVVDWWGMTAEDPNAVVMNSVDRQRVMDLIVERLGLL